MLGFFEQNSFGSGFFEMFFFDEVFLTHGLDSVILAVMVIFTEHDFTKGASAKDFEEFKFFEGADVAGAALGLEDEFGLSLGLFRLLR